MSKKQQEYNRRWINKNEENRMLKRKSSYKSTAKTFIRNYAEEKDLNELSELIKNKSKEFE